MSDGDARTSRAGHATGFTEFSVGSVFADPGPSRPSDLSAPVTVVVQFSARDAELLNTRAATRGLTVAQHLYECAMVDLGAAADLAGPRA